MAEVEMDGLGSILSDLDRLVPSPEEKKKACNAGAEVYIKHLIPKIPVNKDRKKGKHLRDMVTYKPGQYADGSTDVGFTKKGFYFKFVDEGHYAVNGYRYTTKKGRKITSTYAYHSRNPSAKDLNYGTKYIKGQHFMEHAAEEAQSDAQEAMKAALLSGGRE